jgi:hypothetical protein
MKSSKLQRRAPGNRHVFDEIAKRCPMACTSEFANRRILKFGGVAQSSTRVSAFMRNIDGWPQSPELASSKPGTTCRADVHPVRRAGGRRGRAEASKKKRVGGGSWPMNMPGDIKSLDPNDLVVALPSGRLGGGVVIAAFLFYFLVWPNKP